LLVIKTRETNNKTLKTPSFFFLEHVQIQVALRWIIAQGATPIVKSFNKERMKINLEVFDWELSEVDLKKIKQVSQCRGFKGERFITENGPYKTAEDLWD